MADVILVDSDVLIAHLRGHPPAHEWLARTRAQHGRIQASQVSVTELIGGMRSAERTAVRTLLRAVELVDIDGRVSHRAGELRRRYRRSHSGIGLGDYLIAATADVHSLQLATLNVRHFPMFPDLVRPFEP